jgi:hypothetical protein
MRLRLEHGLTRSILVFLLEFQYQLVIGLGGSVDKDADSRLFDIGHRTMDLAHSRDGAGHDDGVGAFVVNRDNDLAARFRVIAGLNEEAAGRDVGDEAALVAARYAKAAR